MRTPVTRFALVVAAVGAVWIASLATPRAGQGAPAPSMTFVDATARSGISFVHENGAAGAKWYPELFGGGVVVLDVDDDRWPDLLFINGRPWQPAAARARHALYRNNGNGTFTDITAGSGLDTLTAYGIGATVGDFDNDGRDDLFMTAVEGGRLLRNEGNNHFADVTERAGIRNTTFSVSAAWLDYDRDGRLDLFVGNYVAWSPAAEAQVRCTQDGERGYCGPDAYKPVAPKLYRNLGGGRFEDATGRAGLDDPSDKVMGVAVLDYNGDLWPDLFVGSDRVPARLYRNSTKGAFIDEGVRAGVALSENGVARANMGTDAADYDRSGRPHIVVGNFLNEMLGLYRNENGATFRDVAPRSEVGRASLLAVTWATFFLDADLDGFLDIFAANGGTDESQGRDARARVSQPPLLLRNRGNGTFENITRALGTAFNRPVMARGAAYADVDGDGDLDIAMTTLDGPAYLFMNDGGNRNRWLRVRATGAASNRSGIGAVVRITSPSGTQWQMVRSGSSYASQSELTVTFGLGADQRVTTLEVVWPSGTTQRFNDLPANQVVEVHEERGLVPSSNRRATSVRALWKVDRLKRLVPSSLAGGEVLKVAGVRQDHEHRGESVPVLRFTELALDPAGRGLISPRRLALVAVLMRRLEIAENMLAAAGQWQNVIDNRTARQQERRRIPSPREGVIGSGSRPALLLHETGHVFQGGRKDYWLTAQLAEPIVTLEHRNGILTSDGWSLWLWCHR